MTTARTLAAAARGRSGALVAVLLAAPLVAIVLAAAAVPVATAGVYRWVDENGNVQFSDRPPDRPPPAGEVEGPERASVEEILAREAAEAERARAERRARQLEAAIRSRLPANDAPAPAAEEPPVTVHSRYSCEEARRFRDLYASTGETQYRPTGDGGFRPITAEELAAQQAQWERAVALLCREGGGAAAKGGS